MHLVRLVTAQVAIFRFCSIVEDKLCRIAFAHRNHVVRDHFAHVDKRHIEFFGKFLVERRVAAVTIMDLRRRIIVQATNRAHDNRISAFRTHIAHKLFHVGGKEVFRAVVHVVNTELDNDIVASLQLVRNATTIGAALLKEHVVIADRGVPLFVLTAATKRHAALSTVHHCRLVYIEPVMKILALALFGIITISPVLHGGITKHINSDLCERKRRCHHRSNDRALPKLRKHTHLKTSLENPKAPERTSPGSNQIILQRCACFLKSSVHSVSRQSCKHHAGAFRGQTSP